MEGKWHYHFLRRILRVLRVDWPIAVIKTKRYNLLPGVSRPLWSTIHLKLNTAFSVFPVLSLESGQWLLIMLSDNYRDSDYHYNVYDSHKTREVTPISISLGTNKDPGTKYAHDPSLRLRTSTWTTGQRRRRGLFEWTSSSLISSLGISIEEAGGMRSTASGRSRFHQLGAFFGTL